MKNKLLLLGAAAFALSACGSSGRSSGPVIPKAIAADHWELDRAYARLHSMGLRVKVGFDFPRGPMYVSDLSAPLDVWRVRPLPGTHVNGGSVVTLTVDGIGLASEVGIPPNHRYRVPDFVGRPVTVALRWLNERPWLHYTIPTPPLPPSNAPSYWSAFRVTAQRPAAGGFLFTGGRHPYAAERLLLTVTPRR